MQFSIIFYDFSTNKKLKLHRVRQLQPLPSAPLCPSAAKLLKMMQKTVNIQLTRVSVGLIVNTYASMSDVQGSYPTVDTVHLMCHC